MNIQAITFGKKYLGKAPVKNNNTGKKELLDFVEYNDRKDISQLKQTAEDWEQKRFDNYIGMFASDLKCDIRDNIHTRKYYGIEDEKGDIQAICEVRDLKYPKGEKKNYIECIEVNPDNAHSSEQRKFSKLGTSIFKEIVKIAKRSKAKGIEIIDASEGFWDKMPYIEDNSENDGDLILHSNNYDECIKKLDEMI